MERTIKRSIQITPTQAGRLLSWVGFFEKNKDATGSDFANDIGISRAALQNLLTALMEKGLVVKRKRGVYAPTSIFHEHIAELMEISRIKGSAVQNMQVMLTKKEEKLLESAPTQEEESVDWEEVVREEKPAQEGQKLPESVQVDLKGDILSLTVGKVKINIHTGE